MRTRLKPLQPALLGILLGVHAGAFAQTPLTAERIIERVAEKNRERAANLKSYRSQRTYRLQYRGFPASRDAEMVVEAEFDAPSTKEFHVVAERGSKFILDHVLHILLTSEQEALNRQNQQETSLTADNYRFELERVESESDHRYYVLRTQPRRKNKFLFRGRVWIDADDFAVVRIDAEPAKNPSFWISKTHIKHQYVKVDEFWLPAQNISQTHVLLGGVATLTIDYGEYFVSRQPGAESTAIARADSEERRRDQCYNSPAGQ